MKKLTILLVLTLLFSCSNTEKSKIVSTYNNGNWKVVHQFINPNDTSDYVLESYYSNGQMEMRGRLKKNTQEGHWTWWYENGNLQDETYFLNGEYTKFRKHWREDGKRLSFEFLSKNCISECCDGKVITFDSLDKVKNIINRTNGVRNGKTISFFPNGNIDQIFNYKSGILDSIKYEFHPNGKLKVYGYYVLDKEQGNWKYFDTTGKYIGHETYKDGLIIETKKK